MLKFRDGPDIRTDTGCLNEYPTGHQEGRISGPALAIFRTQTMSNNLIKRDQNGIYAYPRQIIHSLGT